MEWNGNTFCVLHKQHNHLHISHKTTNLFSRGRITKYSVFSCCGMEQTVSVCVCARSMQLRWWTEREIDIERNKESQMKNTTIYRTEPHGIIEVLHTYTHTQGVHRVRFISFNCVCSKLLLFNTGARVFVRLFWFSFSASITFINS